MVETTQTGTARRGGHIQYILRKLTVLDRGGDSEDYIRLFGVSITIDHRCIIGQPCTLPLQSVHTIEVTTGQGGAVQSIPSTRSRTPNCVFR